MKCRVSEGAAGRGVLAGGAPDTKGGSVLRVAARAVGRQYPAAHCAETAGASGARPTASARRSIPMKAVIECSTAWSAAARRRRAR